MLYEIYEQRCNKKQIFEENTSAGLIKSKKYLAHFHRKNREKGKWLLWNVKRSSLTETEWINEEKKWFNLFSTFSYSPILDYLIAVQWTNETLLFICIVHCSTEIQMNVSDAIPNIQYQFIPFHMIIYLIFYTKLWMAHCTCNIKCLFRNNFSVFVSNYCRTVFVAVSDIQSDTMFYEKKSMKGKKIANLDHVMYEWNVIIMCYLIHFIWFYLSKVDN